MNGIDSTVDLASLDDDEMVVVGRPLPRIDWATPGTGRTAKIRWRGGAEQTIDLKPAFANLRIFLRLRTDDELFKTMKVNEDGNALEWDDGAELSAMWIEELAEASLDNEEFRQAMDRLNLTLDGMASRLGIARRLVADYRKDKPIPKHIALATRYLLDQRKAG
jgi:hypothetical protein